MATAALLGVVGVTGCTSYETDVDPVPAVTVPDPPPAFTNRTELPDCGSITLDQGESLEWPADIAECLAIPEGGEAMVQYPTTEGDPIREYYRVGPGVRGVEIYTDHTDDAFGTQAWTHQVCPGSTAEDIPTAQLSCTEPVWLVLD